MASKRPSGRKPRQGILVEATVEDWNREDAEELRASLSDEQIKNITVSSRDWTVETIVSQIKSGNIDLDPDFQRRNAWHDERRSKLIESFVLGFPVPQIVLAENPAKKKSYIVIDGKQRLLTIAGFYLEKYRSYWNKPKIQGLQLLKNLNKVSVDSFLEEAEYSDQRRQIANADIRTTVISGFEDEGLLYDIFYRLNTGSVPLSSQELRQVLHRGEFSRYLVRVTNSENPIWTVLNLEGPDPRLRDVELLLRLMAISLFSGLYRGNLKSFLDGSLVRLNTAWEDGEKEIVDAAEKIFEAVRALIVIFGENAGKKFRGDVYERRINRAIFEVQSYYLQDPKIRRLSLRRKASVVQAFEELCVEDPQFLASVEATTKSVENYRIRFERYRAAIGEAIGFDLPPLKI